MILSLKSAVLLLAAAALTGCGGESGVAGGPAPAATPVAVNSSNPTVQGVTAPQTPTDAATPAAATPPVATAPTPAARSPATGSATLDWLPPTQTTDGGVLADLSGYYVYYGPDASRLSQRVQLSNPGLTAYVIDGLPQGSYTFAVSAYNSAGIESALSNVVSKTVL